MILICLMSCILIILIAQIEEISFGVYKSKNSQRVATKRFLKQNIIN